MSAVVSPDRSKYLGSSDVAAILGISPWRTALDVYLDKIEPRREPMDPARERVLSRGKRMEPYVIDLLAEETGLLIVKRGARYLDPEHPFIAAEIDAEAESGENIEIKTVSPFKAREWGEVDTDEVPLHYTAQVMHALMVTGRKICVMGVLIGGDDFRTYRIERDDETISAIREREVAFWQRVQSREPPEPSTVADVVRLYGAGKADALEASPAIAADVAVLHKLREDSDLLRTQIEATVDRIKLYLADSSVLTLGGKPIATWKAQSSKRFDTTRFKAAHPALYEQFLNASETRVFRLK